MMQSNIEVWLVISAAVIAIWAAMSLLDGTFRNIARWVADKCEILLDIHLLSHSPGDPFFQQPSHRWFHRSLGGIRGLGIGWKARVVKVFGHPDYQHRLWNSVEIKGIALCWHFSWHLLWPATWKQAVDAGFTGDILNRTL